MRTPTEKIQKILIPAVTPYFLEKGVDWFKDNFSRLTKAAKTDAFWQDKVLVLEEGGRLKLSAFLKKLSDLGYERTDFARRQAEFSQKGGFLTIFPINSRQAFQIEFLGNLIERILPLKEEKEIRFLKPKARLGDLARLKPGDYVVHLDHGIGIFRGYIQRQSLISKSESLNADFIEHPRRSRDNFKFQNWDLESVDKKQWFFGVEYAPPQRGRQPDRLFVPLEQAKKISMYLGFETPKIHRLGGGMWFKTKRRIKEDVIKLAKELLGIYAERELASRIPYSEVPEIEKALAASFPFEETEDQIKAIEDVARDFRHAKPMDRVLVGDVGFGKTEVALRVAFKVVLAGKQVAVIAPTTILAWQHFQTFKERLQSFPLKVAILSRLLPKAELKKTLQKIENGSCDIVIGTHRLLLPDVKFKNLGLLIVDEEQRFGVRQKEILKKSRPQLDVLSLSATPIPRTMYLALSKIRPMSILKTPPSGRIPIKTFVLPYSKKIIREAIGDELKRKGQVYFLHNRIETMEVRQQELKELVPQARVSLIHGRLPEQSLIKTMDEFRKGEIDVLVATTIIENGLDLSNVNTLIVADSSRLGLAEAYQLRGRIGRGEREARAFFLYRPASLTELVIQRLDALQQASYLGAGYEIALKDLQIRGAGNILGREQSGAINAVGLNLYLEMLSQAVEVLADPQLRP